MAWEVLVDQDESEMASTAGIQYQLQQDMSDPTAFTASTNPNVLYIHEAMKAPDCDKFIDSMGAKLKGHKDMGNFIPIPFANVPKGIKLIDMVWSMHQKRHIKSQETYKWKAHLNAHGSQQENGVHSWETYAPS